MVFEKGLKVNNSRWDRVVRKLSGNYNPPGKEEYTLGKGYPKEEDEEND